MTTQKNFQSAAKVINNLVKVINNAVSHAHSLLIAKILAVVLGISIADI